MAFLSLCAEIAVLSLVCGLLAYADEKRTVKTILDNYARVGVNGRPTGNSTEPTKVNITFGLIEISEFNIENREVIMIGWTALEWNDEFLKWDPAETGTSHHISLDTDQIWVPDILLSNALSKPEPLHNPRVHVTHSGRVSWINSFRYQFSCRSPAGGADGELFECHMKFASWSMDSQTLDLRNKEDRFDTVYYVANMDWEFFSNRAVRQVVELPWGMTSAQVKYEFTLKRRPRRRDDDDAESSAARADVTAFLPVALAALAAAAAGRLP